MLGVRTAYLIPNSDQVLRKENLLRRPAWQLKCDLGYFERWGKYSSSIIFQWLLSVSRMSKSSEELLWSSNCLFCSEKYLLCQIFERQSFDTPLQICPIEFQVSIKKQSSPLGGFQERRHVPAHCQFLWYPQESVHRSSLRWPWHLSHTKQKDHSRLWMAQLSPEALKSCKEDKKSTLTLNSMRDRSHLYLFKLLISMMLIYLLLALTFGRPKSGWDSHANWWTYFSYGNR